MASLIVVYQAEWYQNKRKTPGKIENKNRVYLLLSYSTQQELNLAEWAGQLGQSDEHQHPQCSLGDSGRRKARSRWPQACPDHQAVWQPQ